MNFIPPISFEYVVWIDLMELKETREQHQELLLIAFDDKVKQVQGLFEMVLW